MKQIWPNYSYSPTTNVLTLTGLNIDRDQLLLVTAADRGRIMYNFADSSVTASAFTSGANTALTLVATTAGLTTTASLVIYYDDQVASNSVTVASLPAITGTVTIGSALPAGTNKIGSVTASISDNFITIGENIAQGFNNNVYQLGTIGLVAGTQRIGVVTIGGGTVTIGAGTAQIGSVTVGNTVTIAGTVTANPTGTQTIAGSVTLGAGTSQIGSVTASISNSVVTFYPLQGTTVSNTTFTSITPSTTLVSAVAGRDVLTVFNEGPTLYISPEATCTTISYQVRLSAGDYWECPASQISLAHTAVFATAGTARVTQII